MVNLYKLLNVLEQRHALFQLNKWKTEGIWYPITQYKKESDEIQVVTNHNSKPIPNRMGMARQSTSRGL